MGFRNKLILSTLVAALIMGGFFYFRSQIYYSHGNFKNNKSFEIKKGEGNESVASRLVEEGIITGKVYFYYFIKSHGLQSEIMPGIYELSGAMTIPEITHLITTKEEQFKRITFPEGWDARKMAERLNENNLPGDDFLTLIQKPGEMKKRYSYLSGEGIKTLEGYLFPDTYFFKKDIQTKDIIGRLLDTFDEKLDQKMRQDINGQNRSIEEAIVMASIVEREVQAPEDMKIVAGIFWKRLAIGQRLQSDATLSYFLNDKTDQHSAAELRLDSPYNSYLYASLPPTPIGNPGLNAIRAAIYPEESPYNYFLTATVDDVKKVIYSKTFEEHVANRNKYGL